MATDGESLTRSLRFRVEPDGAELVVHPEIVIVAGYTGRDREAVLDHIVVSSSVSGVAPPASVPTFYAVSPELVTQGNALVTTETATSGEAEAGLVVVDDELYVTVCSDHTDRAAERLDIALSKARLPQGDRDVGMAARRYRRPMGRAAPAQLDRRRGGPLPGRDARLAPPAARAARRDPLARAAGLLRAHLRHRADRRRDRSKPALPGRASRPETRLERSLGVDYAVATVDLLRLEPTDSVRLA